MMKPYFRDLPWLVTDLRNSKQKLTTVMWKCQRKKKQYDKN